MRRVWRTPTLSNSRCQFLSQNPFYIQTLHLILLLLSLPTTPQPWDGIIVTESDYQSLQAFKQELVDPNGALSSWNVTAAGACSGSWIGIKCAQGQVIVIHLPWRGLSGRITERIGQFQALRKLSLHDNSIGGAVPTALGFLRNLRGVQLFNNRLSGTIPASLGFCALLQTLELGNNSLSGMIPDSLGNSSKLIRLSLGHNSLSGPIPDSLFTLKNLSVLNLHGNFLDGLIPDAVMSLSSIRDLDLSHNRLSGGIPGVLAELPHLESLNLSYNNLSGSVPQALSHRFNSLAFTGNPHLSSSSLSSNNTAPLPAPRRSRKKDVILIGSGILCITLMATCCILLSCSLIRKRKANAGLPPTEVGGKLVHFDLVAFTADDLLCASAEVLGRSMYGTMYKTTMENGVHVAVKRLREKITKGEKEFEREVHGLGKIRHPNVLAIRSYYVGSKGQKLLVFDYLPRGNLANVLHGNVHGTPVGWPARVAMAKGIARGLLHLHEDAGIVHGNLTSNNVLLDEHMNVKIADFGLSKLMTEVANAHAAGTAGAFGYWAPELTKTKFKKATAKSDVYSFGVIMLELLTGRSPIDVDLPRWVASIVREGWTNEVFDLELLRDASALGDELVNGLKLALHCIDPVPSARPEAAEILRQLEEIRVEAYGGSSSEDESV